MWHVVLLDILLEDSRNSRIPGLHNSNSSGCAWGLGLCYAFGVSFATSAVSVR